MDFKMAVMSSIGELTRSLPCRGAQKDRVVR
jgi:hypothetical protein